MTQPITSRKLGNKENFFRARAQCNFYRNFVVSVQYSRSPIQDKLLLFRALRKTLIDYPSLTCNVFEVEDERKLIMRPVNNVYFLDLVEILLETVLISDEKYIRYMSETHFSHPYEERPLFKLVVPNEFSLGAAFDHTLADGLVGRYFHEILLDNIAYCDIKTNDVEYKALYGEVPINFEENVLLFSLEKDSKYFRNSVPPPMEMYMEGEVTEITPSHFSKFIPPDFPHLWPGRFASKLERSIAYKHINIPAEDLAEIMVQCRKHKVTLTSYLVVNSALTLQPIFGRKHHFLIATAITLRRFMNKENLDVPYKQLLEPECKILGLHSHQGLIQTYAPLDEFSWDLVADSNAKLKETTTSKGELWSLLRKVNAPDWSGDNKSLFEASLGKSKLDSLKLSNLGYVEFPVHPSNLGPDWTVTDAVFGQDIAPTSEFVVNVIATPIGGLNIVLEYLETYEDTELKNLDWLSLDLKERILKNAGIKVCDILVEEVDGGIEVS